MDTHHDLLDTFKILPLDLEIDINEFRDYFKTVEQDFQHLKWDLSTEVDSVNYGVGGHTYSASYGWALQSNRYDLNLPCPPYHAHSDNAEYRDTALIFGPVKRLKEIWPFAYQFSLVVATPGFRVNWHIDNLETRKCHIPIYTNDRGYFIFEDEQLVLKPGKIYLTNTSLNHSTDNQGDSNRVHIFFKIPADKMHEVYSTTGKL